jgi:heat shock protein HspQ
MVVLLILVLGHVFMVFAVDPYALRSMITGWYNEDRSPEARNARPFYHLFARPARAQAASGFGTDINNLKSDETEKPDKSDA